MLDAILAFALSMLVIATAVNVIVSFIHKILGLRKKELSKMIKSYYQLEFKQVIERELKRHTRVVDKAVIKEISESLEKHDLADIVGEEDLKTLSNISTEDLIESVKRTDLGHEMLEKLGQGASETFDEVARRYENFGKRFTESFRAKSRMWATIVAFFLALILNIDSMHLLDAYLNNNALSVKVVSQMDSVISKYESEMENADDGNAEVDKKAIEDAYSKMRNQTEYLSSAGLPIGFEYFPHRCLLNSGCVISTEVAKWLSWLFGIILTAFLAGLGAPFWYDAVSGLSQLAQKGRQAGNKAEK